MGLCINVFGIPVLGDRECADKFRDDRLKRNLQNNNEHVSIVDSRQEDHTASVQARQDSRASKAWARSADATGTAGENIFGSVAGLAGDVAGPVLGLLGGGPIGGLFSGILGGLGTGDSAALAPTTSTSPLLLAGGALALGAVVYFATKED